MSAGTARWRLHQAHMALRGAPEFEEARTMLWVSMAVDARLEAGPRQGGRPQKLTGGTRGRVGFGITTVAAAAALYAVNGDITTARARMPVCQLRPGALNAGVGNPRVRAGVLRAGYLERY